VTVKFVLKIKAGQYDQESETESTGVIIDPKGLVLCSSTQLGGVAPLLKMMSRGRGGDVSATPTDIKVLIGDDVEGLEAKVLARDTELDLAWVQIKEPGDKKLKAVDFSKGATPKPGQRLVSLRRMGKYFDRTTIMGEGRVAGITAKPRKLYVPAGALAGAVGTPVFTLDGRIAGFMVLQLPDDGEMAGDPMGQRSQMQDVTRGLILPADEVTKATARAAAGEDEEEE